jgi:DNA-binding transcriptional MocR family regulator
MTRTEAVMGAIRAKIASGALGVGDRAPSIRGCARSLGVSPSTVVEAYDRLEAEGVIQGRRGSGFYVARADAQPLIIAPIEETRERDLDPFWISKQSLDADPSLAAPGCGWLPSDWMPHLALRRGLRGLSRAPERVLTQYGSTRGAVALRRLLQARLADEGVAAGLDQFLLTGSGTQAIDMICRLLVRPGAVVLVDDPCYFNFRALLQAHDVQVVGVPYTAAGPDVAVFEQRMVEHRPQLYITNSALHNPTGASLSPQVAHQVLRAASAHGLTIVEDDIFADFEPTPSPRLAVLDGLDRVIRIGSFSKTLSASVRCGYVAARPDLIERLVDLQIATNFGGPSPLAAELVAAVLGGGGYRKHMDEVRRRLVRARTEAIARLAPLGLQPWVRPRGGFYLWCRLPEGQDSGLIARRCLAEGVMLAPGDAFSVSHSAAAFLRFNVAHMGDARIFDALRRAMAG